RWHVGGMFWEFYPQAREILLVRDFRDILCSVGTFNAKRGFVSFGRELVGTDEEYIRYLYGHAAQLVKTWKNWSELIHLVRYEDLILRTREVLQGVFKYLNLDASPSTIDEIIEKGTRNLDLNQHQTSQNPKMSVGRWRQELAPSLQAKCAQVFRDFFKEF